MAVHISLEHSARTSVGPRGSDFSAIVQSSAPSTVNPSRIYELTQSESLTFLYNLLYDEDSTLTKTDVLSVLRSLKEREANLPFAYTEIAQNSNVQGLPWDIQIQRKFYQERARVASPLWFTNVPQSREEAIKNLKLTSYDTKTDFFEFHKFYSRLKNHITHFQLRSLVVCGKNAASGIYYPSSYFHDDTLEPIFVESGTVPSEDCHSYFKLIRLMPDEMLPVSEAMKLDCIVDSRGLKHNSSSRVSSMACSEKFLATGTFEGGFVLTDIEDSSSRKLSEEVLLTQSQDGITNDIDIYRDNTMLTVASNDAKLRYYDVVKSKKTASIQLPFAVNSLASNTHNPHEFFVAADSKDNFILDRRCLSEYYKPSLTFRGHRDFGFSCDWSPQNEHVLVSGNQDGTVRLWDRRMTQNSTHCWNSALGSHAFDINNALLGGPVRNCKFSQSGNHLIWAESLDHVGVIQMGDLKAEHGLVQSRVQLIDFVGKCIGLNVCVTGSGHDEELIIGINDCPLGGILSYRLEAPGKPLPFEFAL